MFDGKFTPEWGKEAQKVLADRHLSVTKLAKNIGMSRPYVSCVINGRVICPKTKEVICKYLGIEDAS